MVDWVYYVTFGKLIEIEDQHDSLSERCKRVYRIHEQTKDQASTDESSTRKRKFQRTSVRLNKKFSYLYIKNNIVLRANEN